jgi:hypothetical protein
MANRSQLRQQRKLPKQRRKKQRRLARKRRKKQNSCKEI